MPWSPQAGPINERYYKNKNDFLAKKHYLCSKVRKTKRELWI